MLMVSLTKKYSDFLILNETHFTTFTKFYLK